MTGADKTYTDVVHEVIAIKGIDVLLDAKRFANCVRDVAGSNWAPEFNIAERNLDSAMLGAFHRAANKGTAELHAASIMVANQLHHDCGLSESLAQSIANDLQTAIEGLGGDGDPASFDGEVESGAPLLDKWEKTPMGWAILGLVFPAPYLALLLALLLGMLPFTVGGLQISAILQTVILAVLDIALIALTVFYAFRIYPSFFTAEPKLKSPQLVAYLNTSFGGIIFGSIWCSGLTKKRGVGRGTQCLFAALLVCSLLFGFFRGYLADWSSSQPDHHAPVATSSASRSPESDAQSRPIAGYAKPEDEYWSNASGTVAVTKSSIRLHASTPDGELSFEGVYVDDYEGFAFYLADDRTGAFYLEADEADAADVVYVFEASGEPLYELLLE